jgi:glutaredoxin
MVVELGKSNGWVVASMLCVLAGGCSRGGSFEPGVAEAAAEGVVSLPEVREGEHLLYTFFDRRAQMRTVDRIADVEPEARRAVMVTDPARHLPEDQVFVADLTVKSEKDERYPVWIEQRGHWLGRVMPRTSVASYAPEPSAAAAATAPEKAERAKRDEKAKKRAARARARRARQRARRAALAKQREAEQQQAQAAAPESPPASSASPPAASEQQQLPKVIVFSTSWCPSCRQARAFLTQRGVRFLELDVEKYPEAAKRMVAIQQANGFREGAVPLIIVNGRAFQGFSRLQLEVAINNMERQAI